MYLSTYTRVQVFVVVVCMPKLNKPAPEKEIKPNVSGPLSCAG